MNPPRRPLIRSQSDVEGLWHALMAPLGFARSSLWFLLIGPDDRPLPQIVEIQDAEQPPEPGDAQAIVRLVQDTAHGEQVGARVAFLRSRPGTQGLTEDDRRWARRLYAACRQGEVRCEVLHVATDVMIVPVPLDELSGLAESA